MVKVILRNRKFEKNFKKRILPDAKLRHQFIDRLELFVEGETGPPVNDHALTGNMKDLRSFSVAGDIRVVYIRNGKNEVILYDIGTHNQVY